MIKKIFSLKTAALLLAVISMCFTFATCSPVHSCNPVNYEITFCTESETYQQILVEQGKAISKPQNPKKDNYTFLYWCIDQELTTEYDFSKSVYSDFSLYAKFTLDGVAVTNAISTHTIKSVVRIVNKSYNTNFIGMTTDYQNGLGSGVIYKIEGDWLYALTNCHVAIKKQGFNYLNLTVYDYASHTSATAELVRANNEYDLAIVRFKIDNIADEKLMPIALNFAELDPQINDDVIALGSPKGQSNAITFGNVSAYEQITLEETAPYYSNVQFNVIKHSAFTNNGSSGGPLLNAKLELIGLNYAGINNTSISYSIPVSKIKEFLAME